MSMPLKARKWKLHRTFFDELGTQLGYKCMDDWYQVKTDDIVKNRGKILLDRYYEGSLSSALQNIYPEHKWMEWRFKIVPQGYWKSIDNQQNFFDWLYHQLGYKLMDQWYTV